MLDSGCLMLDAGCWILDAGYWILDTGYWIKAIKQCNNLTMQQLNNKTM
jgi:hypothetical protein